MVLNKAKILQIIMFFSEKFVKKFTDSKMEM